VEIGAGVGGEGFPIGLGRLGRFGMDFSTKMFVRLEDATLASHGPTHRPSVRHRAVQLPFLARYRVIRDAKSLL
jgi:hypothetical protein